MTTKIDYVALPKQAGTFHTNKIQPLYSENSVKMFVNSLNMFATKLWCPNMFVTKQLFTSAVSK